MQNHEPKAVEPHTSFVARHLDMDELRVHATVCVWWQDEGSVVQLLRIAAADRLRESSKTALKALTSSQDRWAPAGARAEFASRRGVASRNCMTDAAHTPPPQSIVGEESKGEHAWRGAAGQCRQGVHSDYAPESSCAVG